MGDIKNNDIVFAPTKESLTEIEKWLKEERQATGQGFYVNWKTIKDALERSEMATLEVKGKPLGFVIWDQSEKVTRIVIAEIHPVYRNKGFGRKLLDGLTDHFIKTGIVVIELECEPPESETAWKHLGFVEFGNFFNSWGNKRLYKILIPSLVADGNINANEYLSLWDNEPVYCRNTLPVWQWNFQFKDGTRQLVAPIIIACDKDWQISWTTGAKKPITSKTKYFPGECMSGDFLVIESIP